MARAIWFFHRLMRHSAIAPPSDRSCPRINRARPGFARDESKPPIADIRHRVIRTDDGRRSLGGFILKQKQTAPRAVGGARPQTESTSDAPSVRNWGCQRVADGRYRPTQISARHTLASGRGIALRNGVVVQQNPRVGVDIQPHRARLSKSLRPRKHKASGQRERKTQGKTIATHDFLSLL